MKSFREEYERWLDSPALGESEWNELNEISGDEKEIESRFYAPLEFGTAGLRGIMGLGINRMNVHVVRHTTQAFASVILEEDEASRRNGVVICYDCREKSADFAREAASVMAGNGIPVRIFDELRPTPELSFAIREYGAIAGLNITASHNPKEYNGYKVYWSDGAQLPPRHAAAIAEKMTEIDIFNDIKSADFDECLRSGLIKYIGAETDEAFLRNILGEAIDPGVVKKVSDRLKIVYTPFHGAGYKLVPEALRRIGVTELFPVEEQMVTDGSFPTVKSPNPEEPEGFRLAVELASKVDSSLIIGTDPDSDRVGVMVCGDGGEYVAISGNQMGVLLFDYVLGARKNKGTLPENAAVLKTIVTTEMAREVSEFYGVHIEDTFTGFKFMAERVAEFEKTGEYQFVMSYEESYGYMIGSFVRDKDAVTASMLIAEMAAYYLDKGMTLYDALQGLYEKHGYFAEKTLNLIMPGISGLGEMKALMRSLREEPPAEISGVKVVKMRDYLSGKITVSGLGVVDATEIHGSDVLYFELFDGASFIIRPSGTEPKIKIYLLVRGGSAQECGARIEKYEKFANSLRG